MNGIAISPNANQIYTVGEDGLLKFWQFPVPAVKLFSTHLDAINVLVRSQQMATAQSRAGPTNL